MAFKEKKMWEYKGTSKFDIGEGYGELEYDFFTITSEKEFWSLTNFYGSLWRRFDYFLDGYDTTENNTDLSPKVQAKMKEHNVNLCLTFSEEEYKENNVRIRTMIVNEQKQDGTFDTSFFCFYLLKGNNLKTYCEQAVYCEKEGLYNAAIAHYSKAIELRPDSASLYSVRGNAYAKREDYNSAIEDFTKAIKINVNYMPAYIGRGQMYSFKRNYDAAIVDYTQAIQLDPNNGGVYCNRGENLVAKGSYDEAFKDFAKAIELNPDDDYAYLNRAVVYQNKGDYDSAKADFFKALEIDPNNEVVKKCLKAFNESTSSKD
jgi:tetratricopeptide (TPR) repeat protein